MSAIDKPSEPALCSSISSRNSGASSMPLGRTATSPGSFISAPSNWLRAAMRASWPRLARSCSIKSNPLALPSSETAGGANANTEALRICDSAPIALLATAWALRPGAVRSPQGLSLTNAKPVFCPLPAKLKPATVKMASTASFCSSRKWCCTWSSTFTVLLCVAPGGNCTMANSVPWSSSGKKPAGILVNTKPTATTTMA
ncbi:hypothetical protein D3C71_1388760 [compost metagenome]